MRIPQDPNSWTGQHVDKAIEVAQRLFNVYENKLDLNMPREVQDELYSPYLAAREQAIQLARYTHYRIADTKALP